VKRDDLAARLGGHQGFTHAVERNLWVTRCECYEELPVSGLEYAYDALAAHQADVALVWFQEHTTEEWGVLYEGDSEPDAMSDDRDLLLDECITGVYGEGETPPKLVRRRVTAWEEA
jgi:hypothetical protein